MPSRLRGYSRAVIPFVKGEGLGNDYLVLDARDLPGGGLSPAAVRCLCDRHRGVGSDGILLRVPSTGADFGLRIFNPDGSEAEKSGNGLRIFAKYLWDQGGATTPAFTVETPGGVVECECHLQAGRVDVVTVEMGRVAFDVAAIPMACVAAGEAVERQLELPDGTTESVTALSIGNPHCVVFRDTLDDAECRRLGPVLERHPAFPRRTNVQLVQVVAPDRLAIRIWERGAGYTLASGSSSCGAAAAAVRTGRVAAGRIVVEMPGGTLVVDVRPNWSVRLEGPVAESYRGVLAEAFVAMLARE
jgi:diaminopimelate epimerase